MIFRSHEAYLKAVLGVESGMRIEGGAHQVVPVVQVDYASDDGIQWWNLTVTVTTVTASFHIIAHNYIQVAGGINQHGGTQLYGDGSEQLIIRRLQVVYAAGANNGVSFYVALSTAENTFSNIALGQMVLDPTEGFFPYGYADFAVANNSQRPPYPAVLVADPGELLAINFGAMGAAASLVLRWQGALVPKGSFVSEPPS